MKLSLKHKFAVWLINLISKSWRIKFNQDITNSPCIVMFWHGLMLPGWLSFKDTNSYAVVSSSKDGEILSALLSKWGLKLIRGSSSSGGKEVLKSITELSKNNIILMTPDGPKGPIHKMKAGALVAALRANVPLILGGINIEYKFKFIKSWDQFSFPLPFSKIFVHFSDKVFIDKDSTIEQINEIINKLESDLNILSSISNDNK